MTFQPYNIARNGKDEWYTPNDWFNSLLDVMGLDVVYDCASSYEAFIYLKRVIDYSSLENPFSNKVNSLIKANQPLDGYWCNPPFSMLTQFSWQFQRLFEKGLLGKGAILTNSNTEVEWFKTLSSISPVVLFPNKRIQFVDGLRLQKSGRAIAVKDNMKAQAVFFTGDVSSLDFIKLHSLGTVLYNTEALNNPVAKAEELTPRLNGILYDVQKELIRQRSLWGNQQGNRDGLWLTVLAEEIGELAEEVLFMDGKLFTKENYKTELIQVAAVALSMLSYLSDTENGFSTSEANVLEELAKVGELAKQTLEG